LPEWLKPIMPQEHIDFRSLLERVLPLEALPAAERAQVQQALTTGVSEQIEQAALLALAQLERRGAVSRLPSASNGSPAIVRYLARDRLDIITLRLPQLQVRDGVRLIPRASLPAQAQTALVHVRRLLRLDEPLFSADPRTGDPRAALLAQLDLIGRELLGARELRFVPANLGGSAATTSQLSDSWLTDALVHPTTLYYCPDTTATAALRGVPLRSGVRSFVLAAVAYGGGTPLGVVEVRSGEPEPFGPDALALIALIADCCASALERATRIERLVFVDALTGAYNRPYFDLQMRNEIARAQREGASMALCIADIDDFKTFNSTYGYEAGNQVLVQVAQALRSGVRPFDTLCRWGGEEFAVLLAEPVQLSDVHTVSERLRSLVERQSVRVEALDGSAHRVVVTVSIGVAVYPEHEKTPGDLWRAANQALLIAKRPPKNQVVFYSRP
jgi:diguanylate cyclase (GGDEF)-like protein